MIFPDQYKEIYKEMEHYALKYMDAIDMFLSTYEKEKTVNNVVSLAYTKYYKQLKKHKANGYIL